MRTWPAPAVLSFVLALCPAGRVSAQEAAPPAATGSSAIEAPKIIFGVAPALLIRVDGDPVYREVPGTPLQRIVNTGPLIVRDEAGVHYLKILDGWMEAYSLFDAWSVSGVPPEGGRLALRQALAAKNIDALDGGPPRGALGHRRDGGTPILADRTAPAIYISTTPAVLIVTQGAPQFAPVPGTSLEHLANTTAQVFREPTDQELYLLLAGHWFRSWTTEGPWQFVPSDQLPADFAKVPASLLKSNR
jgi:hypothetical protein